jgi:cytidine deaminase
MREFCEDDFQIHMVTVDGWETHTLGEMLPYSLRASEHMA